MSKEKPAEKPANKSRYWTAVVYPEHLSEGWQDTIGDVLQLPYVYCIHDKDTTSKEDEDRKVHVHVGVAFPNTTTFNHALSVFQELDPTVSYVERIISVRHFYDYLIHDTETARKQGKHQYDRSERVTGNGFDIGAYEQVSITDKRRLARQLAQDIVEHRFEDFLEFYIYELDQAGEDADLIDEVMQVSSGFFERLTRGAYLQAERKRKEALCSGRPIHRDNAREIDDETGEVLAEDGQK